jgi:hypothetical protein
LDLSDHSAQRADNHRVFKRKNSEVTNKLAGSLVNIDNNCFIPQSGPRGCIANLNDCIQYLREITCANATLFSQAAKHSRGEQITHRIFLALRERWQSAFPMAKRRHRNAERPPNLRLTKLHESLFLKRIWREAVSSLGWMQGVRQEKVLSLFTLEGAGITVMRPYNTSTRASASGRPL